MITNDRETFFAGSGRIVPRSASCTPESIRELERASIRGFVKRALDPYFLPLRVLDYGAGKPGTCREPQPYRPIVEAAGHQYEAWEPGDRWPNGEFDIILCTQVIQYMEDPRTELNWFGQWLHYGGTLVMTGPGNWPEVEEADLWRFTLAGIKKLVTKAGFRILKAETRAEIDLGGEKWSLGWGIVAVKE